MRIDELKKAKDQRPFQPFWIRMADGREIEIRHPDVIAWDVVEDEDGGGGGYEDEDNGEAEGPLTVVCVPRGGGWEVIELALITSLAFGPSKQAKGKAGRKGKAK